MEEKIQLTGYACITEIKVMQLDGVVGREQVAGKGDRLSETPTSSQLPGCRYVCEHYCCKDIFH